MRTRRADQIILLVCVVVTSFTVGIVARSVVPRRTLASADRWEQGIWVYRVLLNIGAIVLGYLVGLCLVKYLHHRAFMRERQQGAADDPKGEAGN